MPFILKGAHRPRSIAFETTALQNPPNRTSLNLNHEVGCKTRVPLPWFSSRYHFGILGIISPRCRRFPKFHRSKVSPQMEGQIRFSPGNGFDLFGMIIIPVSMKYPKFICAKP